MTNENSNMPPWWPRGADEQLVQECNCESCNELIQALEKHRDGVAVDGKHAPIDSFARS